MNRKILFLAVASLFAETALAQVLPTGATLTRGAGSVDTSGSTMTVSQTSQRAILDFATYSIGAGGAVVYNLPNASSVSVSRVASNGGRSLIDGSITSNGHVMLLNPNGVLFGSTAVVNVGSLTASTGRINDDSFMASNTAPIAITGATAASIENRGSITVAETGLAALVAPSVINSGTITATKGRIVLASAEEATLSLDGNNLYEIAVMKGFAGGTVTNTGTLAATGTGGTIALSALDVANALSGVINLNGVQQATRIEVNGGVVALMSELSAATVVGASTVVNVQKTLTGGGRIQDGINIAASGGTVNIGAGTYAENVTIGKALTVGGAGKGSTIIDPASGDGIVVGGNIGGTASVIIRDLTVQGGGNGIRVADDANLGTITLDGVVVRDNSLNGFISSNGGSNPSTVTTINILDSVFAGNGVAGGSADINLFRFNGDALIRNVDVLGTRGPNLSVASDYGLQLRGQGEVSNMTAAGHVTLDNVRIAGNYRRAQLGIQRYSDASGVSMSGVVLGGALSANVGDGTVSVGSSSAGFGRFFSSDMSGALALADTRFARTAGDAPGVLDISIGGGTSGLRVDAVDAAFDGIARTHTASGADNFDIEDRVAHALDNAGIGGLVIWQTGNLYVTQASGSIQRGIDAACTCTTVHVSAGTFAEQLTINKSLTLVGAGADQTVIMPTSLTADASAMKSILTVGGGAATSVDVSGFTFKGPVPELNAGIFVRDGAYAYIHANKLVDMRESAVLSGNQRGVGIFVGRALLATSGRADIENNVITGYQKGGIVIDGPGSQATVIGNLVTGEGPTSVIAQNGIQISRGASATVSGNTISGNNYTPASDEAVGILIFTPGANLSQGSITIGPNNVSGNEVGVWTNDPRTLSSISLSGVSGNGRDGEADFGGGFAGQGALLEYPAWAASNVANVSATTFGGRQSGDLVLVGGTLRVAGWSGFAAIQPAVDAITAGGSVNVGAGTYAESVILSAPRNLFFSNVTLESLTLNAGAAGSGISGSVTASGPGGFLFNAPVRLLGPTSLTASAGNIAFNDDLQGSYDLTLRASGDISLVSGGGQANPIGSLTISANNFTLSGALWVSGYDIDALGAVALSGHTLNSVGGAPGTIDAGGDVTGHATSDGPVSVGSGGSVVLEIAASAPVVIQSQGPASVSGSAPSLVIDAPSGSASGSFGQVTNAGGGLIDVNGRPQPNVSVAENTANNNRVVPAGITTGADDLSEDARRDKLRRRRQLKDAAEVLRNGEALEIDLSPSN
jgi:filamentous hemagglutinin family protein